MSLIDWFAPKKKHEALASVMPSSGLSRLESTRPFHAARAGGTAQPANRKQERMARRELLYAVVRESMTRAAVLSSAYKFKVLSLDARGRQFLVMMDLAQGALDDIARMAEIEVTIAQQAKARYDILVTSVYWRANEHVAVGDPAAKPVHHGHQKHPAPRAPRPAPHNEHISRPAELHPAQGPSADEVAAFRKALQSGMSKGEAALAQVKEPHQPASYTLLTGFEDTEMVQGTDSQLSGTQYGELR